GTPDKLTVAAQITPLADDVGRSVNVYVGLLVPQLNLILMRSGQFWVPLTVPLPVAFQTVLASGSLQVPVLSDLNVSALGITGAKIVVGYGRDDSDFLNGKYRVVYEFK
uniref:hypothetical protein n=1 Tax=Chitinimonas sp. TaxID=1934313 RepID=UPI0035AD7B31